MQHNITVFCVWLLACAGPARADSPSTQTDRALNGEWVVVQAEKEGRNVADFRAAQIYIDGNFIKWKIRYQMQECLVVVDHRDSPQRFDLIITMPNSQTVKILGIYKFEDDKLFVCLAALGAERPRSFDTNTNRHWFKLELRRLKSTPKSDIANEE